MELTRTNAGAGGLLSGLMHASLMEAVYAAVDLGIPDELLTRPLTVEELAAACGCRPGPLVRIVRGLSVLGITTQEDGYVALTETGEDLFQGAAGHAPVSFSGRR